MSIEPTYTTEPRPSTEPQPMDTTPPTEIASRGGDDPWAAPGETPAEPVTGHAPRQFEPGCRRRLRNLMDDENAYCE